MEQENYELGSPGIRLNRAKEEIQNFCHQLQFNKQYQNELNMRFIQSGQKNRASYWCTQQLNKKIRQQLIKSITNFIKFVQSKGTLKIQVKNHQLDLICRVNFSNSIGYNKYGLMQTKTLYETMYMNFDPNKFNEENIPHKIQIIFRKLYDCLKYFLFRHQRDNRPVDEIDFLLFRSKYIEEKYKKQGMIYQHKFESILIGGLMTSCYRFFRVLFELFLSYGSQFLIPDMKKRTSTFCQRQENFITKSMEYINKKLKEIRDYQNDEKVYLQDWISKQMLGFKYEELYNHFICKASNSIQQIYSSKQSIRFYRFQKDAFNIQNIQTFHDEKICIQPQKYMMHVRGCFRSINQNKSQRQMMNPFLKIDLEKLIQRENKFRKEFTYNHKKYTQFDFVYAWNDQGTSVQVQRSGEFIIIIKTQKQAQLQKVLKHFKQLFPNLLCQIQQKTFILRAHLDINKIDLDGLTSIPYFYGKLDLNTGKRRTQILQKRKKDYKKTLKHKNLLKRASQQNWERNTGQNLPNGVTVFPNNNRLNKHFSEIECNFVIYNYQCPIWDESRRKLRKQVVKIYISDKGFVKISNVRDFQQVRKQYKVIREQIYRYMNRDEIKKQQQKQKQMKVHELADMIISSRLNDESMLSYDTYKIDHDCLHQISGRKTKTYRQKQTKDPGYQKKKTLKVLTWNVWGQRKKYDFLKNPTHNQNKQMDQIDKQRFKTMIHVIKQHQPDIVCLQQVYYLYKNNKDLFHQELIKNLDNTYYYFAQYDPQANDIPQQGLISSRTMILTKFPVKFSNLHTQYKNYWTNPHNYHQRDKVRFKISVLAQFKMKIEPQKNKQFSVLVASVHLKSGIHSNDQQIRKIQFDFLNQVAETFDICILAGDFNTIDQPDSTFQQLSPTGKSIVLKGYTNFQDQLISKDHSYKNWLHKPSIMDKILIKFNNPAIKKQRLKVQDIRFPGSFSIQHLQGQNFRLAYKDGIVRSLSDHIGRFVEFGFSKK